MHHTELLSQLIAEGRLQPAPAPRATVTYHDAVLPRPAQREVRRAPRRCSAPPTASTVEMPRHGERSFCCGAGGARYVDGGGGRRRINETRFAEAAATGADTVATACPYCLVMLDDAAKRAAGPRLRVADVATLLAEAALDGGTPA